MTKRIPKPENLAALVLVVRGETVLLDADLAQAAYRLHLLTNVKMAASEAMSFGTMSSSQASRSGDRAA
ncbi:MAG: hypothetical protein AB7G13_01610 [Lautropia sp.]